MTNTKASVSFNFPDDYVSQLVKKVQEKKTLDNFSETKILDNKYPPRGTTFFPVSAAAPSMCFSERQNPGANFESLANNTDILSKAGFSEKQIAGMLSGSSSRFFERFDRLVKFTQPKIEHYDEVMCLLPSELEYLLRAGLTQNHIADMLLGSGDNLSANIDALKDFVTPWLQCTNERGVSGVRSPLQILEEFGYSKDEIPHFFGGLPHPIDFAFKIKVLLYLIHCTRNVVFKDLFTDKDAKIFSMFDTDGMTLEDVHEILELFDTDGTVSQRQYDVQWWRGF